MTPEDLARELAELKAREKSNTKRLDKLEADHEVLNRMATSIEVMATKQETIAEKVDAVSEKVDVLEHVPGKRWNSLVKCLITALVTALVTAAVTWFITYPMG